jgi:hypothetical protein
MPAGEPRVVLCMKWGNLYSPEYVNVLYSAARENLAGDFRFACLTDNSSGIRAEVETYPIPDIGLAKSHYYRGAWPKIAVFSEDLYGLQGKGLFIDLDTVIWGSIDEFFTHSDDLTMLDSAPWRYRNAPPRAGSGIFSFKLGSMSHLAEKLIANRDKIVAQYAIEQNYIFGEASEVSYWPQPWILSYKYHLRPPLLIDRFRGPPPPGDEAKVICFHGRPRPIDLIHPPKGNWDVFPHYGKGQVPWMVEYWTRHGGTSHTGESQ